MSTRRIDITDQQVLLNVDQVAATIELIEDLRGHLVGIHHGGRTLQEEEKHTLARVEPIVRMLAGE